MFRGSPDPSKTEEERRRSVGGAGEGPAGGSPETPQRDRASPHSQFPLFHGTGSREPRAPAQAAREAHGARPHRVAGWEDQAKGGHLARCS